MPSLSTADLLRTVVDTDSWRSWDAPVAEPESGPDYAAVLAEARASSGVDESVTAGSARVADQPVAVVAGTFDFLAGSVGRAAADRVVAAFERATVLGLPVLGLPVSGGTRMQEGTPAFLRMAPIAAAVRQHTRAGLPYLVYLRHPTTGGVMATWGSLGDVTMAAPGALTGFLGPRVYEGLFGRAFPPGVQTSEALVEAGVIDRVETPEQWRRTVGDLLTAWNSRPDPGTAPTGWEPPGPEVSVAPTAPAPQRTTPGTGATAWDSVQATRAPGRAGAAELLGNLSGVVELSGTQAGETAPVVRLLVGRWDTVGCVVVAQDRARAAARAAQDPALGLGPADLRVARRGMALAERWNLPLVTIVDTAGAELSPAAEHGALAGEIARCLADLSELRTPTLSLLVGAGAGGGALALMPADRVIAAADAWVTPLPPEGASLIRYRTVDRAPDTAEAQHIRAVDLAAQGAVDRIVDAAPDDLAAWRVVVSEELARAATAGPGPLPRAWPASG